MKTNLLKRIVFTMLLFSMLNCSVEPYEQSDVSLISIESNSDNDETSSCNEADPQVRVVNNGTVTFDLEIYDMQGNFLNSIIGVHPTHASEWVSFGEAQTLFSITSSEVEDIKVIYLMENCMKLTIEIGSDNQWIYSEPTPANNE